MAYLYFRYFAEKLLESITEMAQLGVLCKPKLTHEVGLHVGIR